VRERVLHLIGNAHIDPVWLWQWPEGFEEIRATFRAAVDLMDEDSEMTFTADSAAYYAWIEEIDPALFERIKARVAEGRWELAGAMWVEPDCNIPSGESFVRHLLVSQTFFRTRFGRRARIGVNVDPFGHTIGLPQLLRRAGLEAYVFMRPGPHEQPLPAPMFRWRGPDGTELPTVRIPHEYCSPREDLTYHLDKVVAQLPPDWREFVAFYGVGNHGGGPTRANLASIRRLAKAGQGPKLAFDTLEPFVDAVVLPAAASLPVWADDLQHHAVGCYSAHSGIKRWNRRAENLLYAGEVWATVGAVVASSPYPAADLDRAWKDVLFNQFHDILAGTAIEPAYEEARDQLGEAAAIAARALNHGIQAIASRISLAPMLDGAAEPPSGAPIAQPIVIWNAHAWPVRSMVELEYGGFNAADALADDDGTPVAVQETQSYATASDWRKRIVFEAEVPALGYRTYRVRRGGARPAADASTLRCTADTLENDALRVRFDRSTGRIVELVVRRDGKDVADLADASRPRAVVVDDTSDTWSHRRVSFADVVGEFRARSVELIEAGPVRGLLRVASTYGGSELTEDFVLAAGDDALEWRVLLDWREPARMLKLRVSTPLRDGVTTYEASYAALERPQDGAEEPGQKWVDVTAADGGAGVALLNDGKHGFDVLDGSIGVTAVRSPIYAHHDPAEPQPGVRYQFQDIGFQRFLLAVMPHVGPLSASRVARRALELNIPPTSLLESPHPGDAPTSASFLEVSSPDVVVGALKQVEDGSGDVVVRLVETAGVGGACRVELRAWQRAFEADIGPWQVRTWRVPATGDPFEVDLLEERIPDAEAPASARAATAVLPVDEPDRPEPEPTAEIAEGA
jgi:alpha-mannosidase